MWTCCRSCYSRAHPGSGDSRVANQPDDRRHTTISSTSLCTIDRIRARSQQIDLGPMPRSVCYVTPVMLEHGFSDGTCVTVTWEDRCYLSDHLVTDFNHEACRRVPFASETRSNPPRKIDSDCMRVDFFSLPVLSCLVRIPIKTEFGSVYELSSNKAGSSSSEESLFTFLNLRLLTLDHSFVSREAEPERAAWRSRGPERVEAAA